MIVDFFSGIAINIKLISSNFAHSIYNFFVFSYSIIGIAIPGYRISWPSPSFGLLGRSFQIDGVSGVKLLCYFMVVFLKQC
jgi:hypothetical protein